MEYGSCHIVQFAATPIQNSTSRASISRWRRGDLEDIVGLAWGR
jgi:hypothetical protein